MSEYQPSFRALLAFVSSAKHGSFTRAAEELHLTQSAVSRQIRQLEDMLGVQLFVRVNKRVVVSEIGRIYLEDITKAMEGLEEATRRLLLLRSGSVVLNLAVLPSFSTKWLAPRLPRYLSKNPDVTINFYTRLRPVDFRVEPFDAAIHIDSKVWSGATAHPLMKEILIPVCSRAFRQRYKFEGPEGVKGVPLLHHMTRKAGWPQWFEQQGFTPPAVFPGPRFEHYSMIIQAAVSGLGAALLPTVMIEQEIFGDELVPIPGSLLESETYFLLVPEGKLKTGTLENFTHWIRSEADRSARVKYGPRPQPRPVPSAPPADTRQAI